MTCTLVATASVHTTAAACDYLAGRAGPDDEVLVLAVEESTLAGRDPDDAMNVARARLVEPRIETLRREGDPAAEIRAVATDRAVDGIVIGSRRGDPETAGDPPGSTTRRLLRDARRPVVVVPVDPV